ncbi:MAG: wax ester/triacylglycerol synthase domain-containing protein [Rhodococcus sp. (in: high G+C Gram-positive bacteria)]
MATARIDPKDAAFFYRTRPGNTTDHYLTTALEHGTTTVSIAAMVDAIGDRASRIDAMNVRLSVPALNLDYPVWIPRATPVTDDVVVHPVPDGTWKQTLEVLGGILSVPLDARTTSWRVHLLPNVADVPLSEGRATIFVVQLAHCLTDGAGAVAVTRTLLGDDTVSHDLPTPRIGTETAPFIQAAVGLGRIPLQIVGTAAAVVRSLRSSRRLHREVDDGSIAASPPPRSPTPFNTDPGADRIAHVVVRRRADLMRAAPMASQSDTTPGDRVSVTTATLVAIARAMAAFLREQGHTAPSNLGAHVSVALPDDATWSGVNRLAAAVVDLCPTASSRSTQAAGIAESLAAQRGRAVHEAVLDAVRVADRLPAVVVRQGLQRMSPQPGTVDAHTTVSSVRAGPNTLGIAGTRSIFMTAFAGLSPTNGLNHTVFGLGETIAVGILTSPESVPAHRRYAELLADALDGLDL